MNNIIVIFEQEDRELNMSLYEFIDEQYRNANHIMVCHVTEKEYRNMQKQMKRRFLNERLPNVINKEDREYNKFRYLVTDEKGYQITNSNLQYNVVYSIKIYTTETYEDVVYHYKKEQDYEYKIKKKTEELIVLRWSHIIY